MFFNKYLSINNPYFFYTELRSINVYFNKKFMFLSIIFCYKLLKLLQLDSGVNFISSFRIEYNNDDNNETKVLDVDKDSRIAIIQNLEPITEYSTTIYAVSTHMTPFGEAIQSSVDFDMFKITTCKRDIG